MGDGAAESNALLSQLLGVQSGGSHCQIKDLDDTGALRSLVGDVASRDVIGSQTALAIGRAGQRYRRGLAGNGVIYLNDIADGVDVCIGGLQRLVN